VTVCDLQRVTNKECQRMSDKQEQKSTRGWRRDPLIGYTGLHYRTQKANLHQFQDIEGIPHSKNRRGKYQIYIFLSAGATRPPTIVLQASKDRLSGLVVFQTGRMSCIQENCGLVVAHTHTHTHTHTNTHTDKHTQTCSKRLIGTKSRLPEFLPEGPL